MKPIEGKQRTPLNSICFRGQTSQIQVRDFPLLLWKEKDAFICMGVYPPAEKVGTQKIRDKKHAIFIPSKDVFGEKKITF